MGFKKLVSVEERIEMGNVGGDNGGGNGGGSGGGRVSVNGGICVRE